MGEALDRVIGEAEGRVMVATFASLISRIQQVIHAAHKHGRKVGIVAAAWWTTLTWPAKWVTCKYPTASSSRCIRPGACPRKRLC